MPSELGVPQGTPLSCQLFSAFINDVVKCVSNCQLNLFADDILMWIDCDPANIAETIELLNIELAKVYEFLVASKLMLNVSKTKAMIIGLCDTPPDVMMNGEKIEYVHEMKYLGILIDDKLTFKSNTCHVIKKMAKKTEYLRRNKKKFDKDTRVLLYKSLIAPDIDYCSSILFLCNETEMHELQKIQNRALRTLTNGNSYSRSAEMLAETGLLSVRQRIFYNTLLLIWKIRTGHLPSYLNEFFHTLGDSQPYSLRNATRLRPPRTITSAAQNSVIYKGVLMFNELTNENANVINFELNETKRIIRQYVMDKF